MTTANLGAFPLLVGPAGLIPLAGLTAGEGGKGSGLGRLQQGEAFLHGLQFTL